MPLPLPFLFGGFCLIHCRDQNNSQVGMNGDTFSVKSPKECSKKFAAPFKGKFLTRGNVLRIFFLFLELSGPNRAMQPRCAMRFESQTPKSLAIRKSFFASDAKTHSLDLKSHEKQQKSPCENPAMLACDAEIGMFFKIERCEMPAIRTLVAVWPAMRAPAMPNR